MSPVLCGKRKGQNCFGGGNLSSLQHASWAPTSNGHKARELLPSPSSLESTHKTHVVRRGLQQEEDGVRKEHLMLLLPTHEPLLEKLDLASLFCFLALKNVILSLFQCNSVLSESIKYPHR